MWRWSGSRSIGITCFLGQHYWALSTALTSQMCSFRAMIPQPLCPVLSSCLWWWLPLGLGWCLSRHVLKATCYKAVSLPTYLCQSKSALCYLVKLGWWAISYKARKYSSYFHWALDFHSFFGPWSFLSFTRSFSMPILFWGSKRILR